MLRVYNIEKTYVFKGITCPNLHGVQLIGKYGHGRSIVILVMPRLTYTHYGKIDFRGIFDFTKYVYQSST